jgi:hypothetical protein
MAKAIVTGGLLLAVAGCSGSGSGGPSDKTDGAVSSCAPATGTTSTGGTSSGPFSWRDNGTLQCATLVLTGRQTATVADNLEIDTATASTGIDLLMSSYNGPLGGTYSCQTGNGTTEPNVLMEITGLARRGIAAASSCTITISFTTDSAGVQHAQGTFSGTVTGDGGTDLITDGMFDVTIAQQGG